MFRHFSRFSIVLALFFLVAIGRSQDRTFSVSATAGITHLNLGDVDQDNESDVNGWRGQGIPIASFPSLKTSFLYSLKGEYRIDRDIAFTVSYARSTHRVTTEFSEVNQELLLNRSLGFTDYTVGVLYHFPLFYDIIEGYAGGEAGIMDAYAHADAYAARLIIIEENTEVFPYVDTIGDYKIRKMILSAIVGANFRVMGPAFLRADAQYKFGNAGKMDGHVSRIDSEGDETTSIGFDFSGLILTFGVSVRF
jgi:hypothetical protein